jgi:hypothetical protein
MREQRDRTPVKAPEALAILSPVPLAPIACEGSNRRFARFRLELEKGQPSSCAFGLVLKTVPRGAS